jgi:AcrR family transcriptional regulator
MRPKSNSITTRGRPRSFDRAAALRQAMNLFARRGYEGTSIFDLTSAMEITAPSLYAAFGCKEALFREAVELYQNTNGSGSPQALVEKTTTYAAIETMLLNAVDAFTKPGEHRGCLVVLGATNCAAENEGVGDYLKDLRTASTEAIRKRLTEGVSKGELAAAFYATILQGLSIQARDGVSRRTLKAVVRSALQSWPGKSR